MCIQLSRRILETGTAITRNDGVAYCHQTGTCRKSPSVSKTSKSCDGTKAEENCGSGGLVNLVHKGKSLKPFGEKNCHKFREKLGSSLAQKDNARPSGDKK